MDFDWQQSIGLDYKSNPPSLQILIPCCWPASLTSPEILWLRSRWETVLLYLPPVIHQVYRFSIQIQTFISNKNSSRLLPSIPALELDLLFKYLHTVYSTYTPRSSSLTQTTTVPLSVNLSSSTVPHLHHHRQCVMNLTFTEIYIRAQLWLHLFPHSHSHQPGLEGV